MSGAGNSTQHSICQDKLGGEHHLINRQSLVDTHDRYFNRLAGPISLVVDFGAYILVAPAHPFSSFHPSMWPAMRCNLYEPEPQLSD